MVSSNSFDVDFLDGLVVFKSPLTVPVNEEYAKC